MTSDPGPNLHAAGPLVGVKEGEMGAAEMRPVVDVAAELGLGPDEFALYGRHRAKVYATLPLPTASAGKYVLVTATTPTATGSGKTVTAIGLSMGLRRLGWRSAVTLRESALGPTFGLKGGGAGGGAAHVVPLEECLLRLTDTPAVEAANNLLAAVVEHAVHSGAGVDPGAVTWRRVLDVDDRSLRHVVVGLGRQNGPPRETGFDITASSEVMAVLALARDRNDLRRRLDSLVPAWDVEGKPVTAGQLSAAGAMAVLLDEALAPNLMQTSDGGPALVHSGPFGNLASGNSSVIADLFALPRVDYLVTEAGFAADLGAEKFFDLKCPVSGLYPDAVVLVTSVPSLVAHGRPFSASDPVGTGTANLRRHIEILEQFGAPVVVSVNRFPDDARSDVVTVKHAALAAGAAAAVEHSAYADGAEGCLELADAVHRAAHRAPRPEPRTLYDLADSCEDKVLALTTRVYGGADVAWDPRARRDLQRFVDAGYGNLPICVAKTPLSLSHDPTMLGAPKGFTLPVREVRLAAGAGYLAVLTGDVMTMPGLPSRPRLLDMDMADNGSVVGLT